MNKKPSEWRSVRARGIGLPILVLLCGSLGILRADQVDMQNGDRFTGRVVSLNEDKLVLESDSLGTLRLARSKVASITFGAGKVAAQVRVLPPNPTPGAATGSTNRPVSVNPELSSALSQLNTNTIQQITGQFLTGAGPEANNKFNQLLGGLTSGNVSVHDIRVQARSAADQIRAMKRDLGEEAGWTLDAYLGILNHFLNESESEAPPSTVPAPGSPALSPKPQAKTTASSLPEAEEK